MYKDDERGGRPHINIVKLKLLSQATRGLVSTT